MTSSLAYLTTDTALAQFIAEQVNLSFYSPTNSDQHVISHFSPSLILVCDELENDTLHPFNPQLSITLREEFQNPSYIYSFNVVNLDAGIDDTSLEIQSKDPLTREQLASFSCDVIRIFAKRYAMKSIQEKI